MNNQDRHDPARRSAPQQPPQDDDAPSPGEAFPPLPPDAVDEPAPPVAPVPLEALVHGVDRPREEPGEHGES